MPKKRKTNNETIRNIIIGIVLVVIIAIVIFVALDRQETEKNVTEQREDAEILISQSNFLFVTSFYLNEKSYDLLYCNKDINCQSLNGVPIQCPKVDQLTMRFRILNLDSLAFVSCKTSDGTNQYTNQHFAFYPSGKIAELSLQNIAFDKEHNFNVCCRYDDTKVSSNEFCLPTINIKSICS